MEFTMEPENGEFKTTHVTNKPTKPAPRTPTKPAPRTPKKRRTWKRVATYTITGLVILVGVFTYTAMKITAWTNRHEVNWRLPVQTPWVITLRTTPHNTGIAQAAEPALKQVEPIKKEIVYTVSQIVDAIHILESSGGVKDGCIAKGKINGFGFAQTGSGKVWNCYKNYAEVRKLVEQWFTDKLEAMDLATATCYYNTGHKVNNCDYWGKFQTVVKYDSEK